MQGTKTAKQSGTPNIAAVVNLTYTYKDKLFKADPDPVKVREGDTLSFTHTTDLTEPKMHITLDKAFFSPAIFKNGDPPVSVIKTGHSEIHCQFSGKFNGEPVTWKSKAGEGSTSNPRDM